jgi:hypothetical protein
MCSLFARSEGEDPIGTAGSHDLYVLIELPPPWLGLWTEPRAASQPLLDALQGPWERGVRLRPLALAPDPRHSRAGHRRVIFYARPEDPFSRFEKEDYLVPEDQVAPLLQTRLNRPAELARFGAYVEDTAHMRDLLICTHGNVDACCGKFGYRAYRRLREEHATLADAALRVWRCSHFGGHRFAPTALDLPEGRYWGHLTEEAMAALARRAGSVATLRRHYRGWGALQTPFEQVVEREAWAHEGWDWTEYSVAGQLTRAGGERGGMADAPARNDSPAWADVCLEYRRPDGSGGAYEARVEVAGEVMTGGCGEDMVPARQYRTKRLRRIECTDQKAGIEVGGIR